MVVVLSAAASALVVSSVTVLRSLPVGAFAALAILAAPALAAPYPQPPDPFGFDQRPSVYLERGGQKICVVELRGDLEMGSGAKGSLPDCGEEHAYLCPMANPSDCEATAPEALPSFLAWAFSPAATVAEAGAASGSVSRTAGGRSRSPAASPGVGGGPDRTTRIDTPLPPIPGPTEVCGLLRDCAGGPDGPGSGNPETPPPAAVPVPLGLPLVLSGLLSFGLVGAARGRRVESLPAMPGAA